jgi:hypothetical protein
MAIPGFTADSSLPASTRGRSMAGVGAMSGDADEVVPQGLLPPCAQSCQLSWDDCMRGCSWWEWMIGSCVPKCRVLWAKCLADRC